ncbi:MAG TPA: ester cyclase [Dehalococcoidia bacterium]|jgi:predicted ester cyclase
MMALETHKLLVRRIHEEAESEGRLDVIDEAYAESFVDAGHPERGSGPESVKAHVREMRERFPDLRVTVESIVAEGDLVVARVISSGTHRGAFAGLAPTGRFVSWDGFVMRRFAAGRIVQQWTRFDMLGLLRQLGALSALSGGREANHDAAG